MAAGKRYTLRYLLVVALFCVISVVYLGRLFYMQIWGREDNLGDGTTVREVTVQAVRGEIYDRNGKKLVGNLYSHDLSLSYSAYHGMSIHERNEAYLALSEVLGSFGIRLSGEDAFFPFETSYPFFDSYSREATDGESLRHYRRLRVLEDLRLPADTDAASLTAYYENKYQLLATDADGKRRYTDEEIDLLFRFYYDLDAKRFPINGEYTLAKDLSLDLITAIKEQSIGCVELSVNAERQYLYPGYASHILGTVGPIYTEEWEYYNELGYQMNAIVGKSGCEAAFESYLGGKNGTLEIVTDESGMIVSTTVKKEPVAGKDVYLTIDIDLQMAAEQGLADNVEYIVDASGGNTSLGGGCDSGAAVAMDPDTFEVLAIASYPTYDLSTYSEDYTELSRDEALPLFNRALLGAYEPGSTFKLGMAAVSLLEGEISKSETIPCSGRYPSRDVFGSVGCSTYRIGGYHSGGEDVVHAIAYSCNSFFCELGHRLGISKMEDYMARFGFGESTGLELGGISGILAGPTYRAENRHPEGWREGNTWQAAIGQSDNQASPLQLATYLSTLCNGGTRYTAHLLHSVYDYGSGAPTYVFEQSEDTVLDRIELPDSVLSTVFEGMRAVIEEESSGRTVRRWINSSTVPVTVGGKTGTAQNSKDSDNALFVCAAPYNDPEIVVSVVIEQGYTGAYAALTAGRILEEYYDEE